MDGKSGHALASTASTYQQPLALRVKLSYSLPRFSIRAAYIIIQVYGQLYYMQLGAKLRFMAFYTAIGRALDVLTDPGMGWITDRTRTAFGRRKPYLFLGIFIYTIVFGFLFFPPESGDADLMTHWYGCFYCLFFVVDTFANVPYYALGMEVTSDYEERNSLYFWQHAMGQLGTMLGGVLPAMLSDFMGMELRDAYAVTGWSFGIWYSLGIASVLVIIRERPLPPRSADTDGMDADSPPLCREMLRVYRNQAFVPWMMAYILDYAAIGILATMVPLFSQYVLIEPDSTDCRQQCYNWNPSGSGCTCAKLATEWLGWILGFTFLAAMVSVPFWHWVTWKLKKHTAWLAYSYWNVLTAALRIFCGKGSFWLTAILSAINGTAFGGQFIGESVMADLSDYDEFLYGDRAEGMLGVVATLGPKMVLVICFVIPLASIATAGFKDTVWPEDTLRNATLGLRPCEESEYLDACPKFPQPQNGAVIMLVRLGVSLVPAILGIGSIVFKRRFPLKKKEQLAEILQGIDLHKCGQPAKDPISGKRVTIVAPKNAKQRRQMWALEMWGAAFGGKDRYLQEVLAASSADHAVTTVPPSDQIVQRRTWKILLRRAWGWVFCSIVVFAASIIATVFCFGMLERESTSWVPTSLCVLCGASFVLAVVSVFRLKAALDLSKWEVSVVFLQALLSRATEDAPHNEIKQSRPECSISTVATSSVLPPLRHGVPAESPPHRPPPDVVGQKLAEANNSDVVMKPEEFLEGDPVPYVSAEPPWCGACPRMVNTFMHSQDSLRFASLAGVYRDQERGCASLGILCCSGFTHD